MRSMSATRLTASVTNANSSGRIANIRKIGLVRVGADDVAEQAEAVVVRPLEVVDQDRERPLGGEGAERDGAQVERAEQPAVGRERGEAGVVLSRHRVEACARARPRSSRVRPRRLDGLRASPRSTARRRNGPRSSSSAVTAIVVNPAAVAISPAARSRRVLPIPGSPSSVSPTSLPVAAEASSWRIASSSACRPTTAPVARWTCSAIGEKGSRTEASAGPSGRLPPSLV